MEETILCASKKSWGQNKMIQRGYHWAISIDLNHSPTLKPHHGLSFIIIKAPQPFRLATFSFRKHIQWCIWLVERSLPMGLNTHCGNTSSTEHYSCQHHMLQTKVKPFDSTKPCTLKRDGCFSCQCYEGAFACSLASMIPNLQPFWVDAKVVARAFWEFAYCLEVNRVKSQDQSEL